MANVAWLAATDGRHAVAAAAVAIMLIVFPAAANHFFGRIGCRVNRSHRELTKEWGLFWLPWANKAIELQEGDALHVRDAVRSGVAPTRMYYCDLARASGKRVRLGINEHDETPLVQMASALSDALNIPAFNATSEPPVRIFANRERALDVAADAAVQAMLRARQQPS